MNSSDPRPLIAHIVHRFDVGGLENGVVNLINRLPSDRYRHAVVALTQITDFRRRVTRDDVDFIAEAARTRREKVTFKKHSKLCELRASVVKYFLNFGYRAPE